MTAGSEGAMLRPGLWEDYYAPEFIVRIDGQILDPTTKGDILQIGVVLDEKQPASFTLSVSDWDDARLTFKYSSNTLFDPGRTVTIDLGYTSRLVRVMSGVITSLSPRFPESGAPTLTVGGQDRMRQMANRKPGNGDRKLYRNTTDGGIAREIASRWNMKADVGEDGPRHSLVVQKNQDDATFLLERAKRIDYEFYIDIAEGAGNETLHFRPRRDGRGAAPIRVFEFEWGRNLISFSPRLSTTRQVSEVTVRGWDGKAKKPIVYTARSSDLPSSAGGAQSGPATAGKQATEVIVDQPVLNLEEAKRLATSRLMERANQFTTGSASVIGLPDLRPGDNVSIANVGPRFSGQYHVTKVFHSLGANGLTSALELERAFGGEAATASGPSARPRR
jgi:phage protein D